MEFACREPFDEAAEKNKRERRVSKGNLGSKLKVRLGEWEAYGDQPVSVSEAEGQCVDLAERELVRSAPSENKPLQSEELVSNAHAPYATEAQLEELRSALEHERDQSRRLLEAGVRAVALLRHF